jgi:hypothetical protein
MIPLKLGNPEADPRPLLLQKSFAMAPVRSHQKPVADLRALERLQYRVAQAFRIALPALRKFNDLLGDDVGFALIPVAEPQAAADVRVRALVMVAIASGSNGLFLNRR